MMSFNVNFHVNNRNSTHLYRHLLRESSYLPEIVRPFVVKRIRKRFRVHRKNSHPTDVASLRQDGNSALRTIRAAVAGDHQRLQKIFLLAFGRRGKRRRELLSHFLRDGTIPSSSEELDAAIEAAAVTSASTVPNSPKPGPSMRKGSPARHVSSILNKWDLKRLRGLAKSQKEQDPIHLRLVTNSDLVKSQAVYPEHNRWGRPLSERAKRVHQAKGYQLMASRVLPPLPKDEWNLLGRLTQGTVEEEPLLHMPSARRKAGTSLESQPGSPALSTSWQHVLKEPIGMLERQRNARTRLLSGEVDDGNPQGTRRALGHHTYTPRTLRRLLLAIWRISPTSVINEHGAETFKWGHGSPVLFALSTMSPAAQAAFFQDDDGNPLHIPTESGTPKKQKRKDRVTLEAPG